MSDINFILYSLPMLLSRNKSHQWRALILTRAAVLLHFLYDNQLLIAIEPFDESGQLKEDVIIKQSDVTSEGLAMFKQVIPGWWRFLDRGGKLSNTSRLANGLAKLRATSP